MVRYSDNLLISGYFYQIYQIYLIFESTAHFECQAKSELSVLNGKGHLSISAGICLKVDIGKILGKLPRMSKIPLQGNGMDAIPKI